MLDGKVVGDSSAATPRTKLVSSTDGVTSTSADGQIRGDAYHFGLCTLYVKRLPAKYAAEGSLRTMFTELLELCGKTGSVVQATVREKKLGNDQLETGRRTWALVTFSNVTSANKILSRNASHIDGLGLQMSAIDVVAASNSDGEFKRIYGESKRKATAEMKRLGAEKQKKEERRRQAGGGINQMSLAQKGYTYPTCTLHVRNIPKMKSLRADTMASYEAAVVKIFQDHLDGVGHSGRVVQATIRHREYTTCKKTGREIPALSWGLVTLDSQDALADVQQCDAQPFSLLAYACLLVLIEPSCVIVLLLLLLLLLLLTVRNIWLG